MARNAAVDSAVDALISMGVLSETGLEKLGQLFQGVQALGGVAGAPAVARRGRRGRPRGAAGGVGGGRRGRRAKVEIPAAKLKELKDRGKTNNEIAQAFGVSPATINNKLRAAGLTKPRGGRKGKK